MSDRGSLVASVSGAVASGDTARSLAERSGGHLRSRVAALVFALLSVSACTARSLEIGPQVARTMPTGNTADFMDPGFLVGLTASSRENSWTGMGIDLGYHFWPGSAEANVALNDFLSRIMRRPVTNTKASYSALQFMIHMKVTPPLSGPAVPWVRLGMGAYLVSTQLEILGQSARGRSNDLGLQAGLGVDLRTGANHRLAFDVTYHRLSASGDLEAEATLLSFGARYLFVSW